MLSPDSNISCLPSSFSCFRRCSVEFLTLCHPLSATCLVNVDLDSPMVRSLFLFGLADLEVRTSTFEVRLWKVPSIPVQRHREQQLTLWLRNLALLGIMSNIFPYSALWVTFEVGRLKRAIKCWRNNFSPKGIWKNTCNFDVGLRLNLLTLTEALTLDVLSFGKCSLVVLSSNVMNITPTQEFCLALHKSFCPSHPA